MIKYFLALAIVGASIGGCNAQQGSCFNIVTQEKVDCSKLITPIKPSKLNGHSLCLNTDSGQYEDCPGEYDDSKLVPGSSGIGTVRANECQKDCNVWINDFHYDYVLPEINAHVHVAYECQKDCNPKLGEVAVWNGREWKIVPLNSLSYSSSGEIKTFCKDGWVKVKVAPSIDKCAPVGTLTDPE